MKSRRVESGSFEPGPYKPVLDSRVLLQRMLSIGLSLWAFICTFSPGCTYTSSVDESNGTAASVEPQGASSSAGLPPECTGPAKVVDGHRRLALLVGVEHYVNPSIPALDGPASDVAGIKRLLVDAGFAPENLCVLIDAQATTANFLHSFQSALVDRAQADDTVVLYFAGHGSQTRDLNGDEPDEQDETLLFSDARTPGKRDLTDDTLHGLLSGLHARTKNITLLIDACNSGSASRDGMLRARFVPPEQDTNVRGTDAVTQMSAGDETAGAGPASLPGLVFLSAAADGSSAYERDGHGVFTASLLQVLGEPSDSPLTWAQVMRRTALLMKAQSVQIPYAQGAIERQAFGVQTVRPVGWEVVRTDGERVFLQGLPLMGWSEGAEAVVIPGNLPASEVARNRAQLARIRVQKVEGASAEAKLVSSPSAHARSIRPGDIAQLDSVGFASLRLSFRIRPENVPDGVSTSRANAIRKTIEATPRLKPLVQLVSHDAQLELGTNAQGQLQLQSMDGIIRNTFTSSASTESTDVARALWGHALRQALLQTKVGLASKSRATEDVQSDLSIQVRPASSQDACLKDTWGVVEDTLGTAMPLCYRWQVEVSLAATAPKALLVGGLVLSSDGGLFPLPQDGMQVRVEPGSSYVFPSIFRARLPLELQDDIILFGTEQDQQLDWQNLSSLETQGSRGLSTLPGPLSHLFSEGERGQTLDGQENNISRYWTFQQKSVRVLANLGFEASRRTKDREGMAQPPPHKEGTREITLPGFDIRPYLPDNRDTALYKVLMMAYDLAHRNADDGVAYAQHDWSLGSDEANLSKGIDCSRAVWFAFTRSGLAYNHSNTYLSTAQMVNPNSLMREKFERCDTDGGGSLGDLRLGDLLVYRDDTRGVGHVVMVIDPRRRYAWGSHGWDGNVFNRNRQTGSVGAFSKGDRGVEFQAINERLDMERWDRSTVKRVACWRYRQFSEEAKTAGGRPGVEALRRACNPEDCKAGR